MPAKSPAVAEHTDLDPVLVEVWRGPILESQHLVDAVVVDAGGSVVAGFGELARPVIPRSAIKAVQALPLIMTGAAERFAVTDDEVALACSSHSAEPEHVAAVVAWLDRVGSSVDTLECGPDKPIDAVAAEQLIVDGVPKSRVHNCCSGKHSGFISVAHQLGVDPGGYLAVDHPVQQQVVAAIETMTGLTLDPGASGIDGCGIPVFAMPLRNLAHAMARLVNPDGLPDDYVQAANRVSGALTSRAFLVSGTGRSEVRFAGAATEPLISKGGAEGVFMGALPDRGLGFALKSRDGSSRGVEAATDAVLQHLGAFAATAIDPTIRNKAGDIAGQIQVQLQH